MTFDSIALLVLDLLPVSNIIKYIISHVSSAINFQTALLYFLFVSFML